MAIEGLNAPVLIRRDEYGIVYIEAENDRDAWYGLGFCQGQDRTFQLEGLARVVRGTLAEMVVPDGLAVDRLSRRIGFAHSAQKQMAVLDAKVRQMAEDFGRGINDGMKKGLRRKPHEFTLLRAEPTPWTAADVLGMLKLISFLLASNWDSELMRLKLLLADGPEALAALDPAYPDWLPLTIPPGEAAGQVVDWLAADLRLMTAVTGQCGGANNWAIAPDKTASGRPILANDPHLAASLPPHWYLAHVYTPEWAVAGASFVGAPGFPAGFDGHCAWGITAGLTDNTDLYVEEVAGDGRVRQGDEWVECPVRVEVIRVKGGQPVEDRAVETPRGPIVGPALAAELGAISMQATWLATKPVRGFFMAHKVRDFEAFRQNFADWPGLPLNMAYADAEGNIGWQLVGESPRRKRGWGTIPLSGADPANGWEAEGVPFAQMPRALNPDTGFVATANNKPISDDVELYLGADWIDGYRLARIAESLAARDDWTLADAMVLQMDQVSIPWRQIRELVLAVPAAGDAGQAVDLLAAWDGVVAADSPRGLIVVQRFMLLGVVADLADGADFDLAAVNGIRLQQLFEQVEFAGAVGADQSHPLAVLNFPAELAEYGLTSQGDADFVQID